MLNIPIVQDPYTRTWHIILCVLFSLVYACVYGGMAHLPILGIIADTIITAAVMFAEEVLLWNIFTYSRLETLELYISTFVQIIYVAIAIGFLLGLELLIINIVFRKSCSSFTMTLPGRVFGLAMIYCIFRIYFLHYQTEESEDQQEIENSRETAEPISNETIKRITVKVGQKIKVISIEDILYLKAEDDYVSVVTAEGHWLKSERLKDFESSLPASQFARVHRSYIVNIGKISKIERYGQKQMLSLTDGKQIKISMTGYKVLREKLNL